MIRNLLHETGRRIVRTLTADKIQTLSPPPPPPPDPRDSVIKLLARELGNTKLDQHASQTMEWNQYREFCHELQEARALTGSGPWKESDPLSLASAAPLRARESDMNAQGAFGDFELALQNVDWRREINFAWLQFSRWGIQQIILISRLYYLKNPIIRRLIDVCALYVFARGVEVSSPDKVSNQVLKDFFARNQSVLGQSALIEHEKRKYYDGNLFFVFFRDETDSGEVNIRTIDAVEVQDIVTDPDDTDTQWFFRRDWSQRTFDPETGAQGTKGAKAWYPALGYDPAIKIKTINNIPVMWDNPVLHRKVGYVGKWTFGCPIIYPALDWAKAARKFLEAVAAVKAALAQISMQITTKGGQQALAGIKQQLETTVGTGNSGWYDQNPTAVNGSVLATGPGTTLGAFKSSGEGGDPEEVKQYVNMCCMVVGVPPTFAGFLDTANLATATTLDRPTELNFQARQEDWRPDFVKIGQYVLSTSGKAANGKVREARNAKNLTIRESYRRRKSDGSWVYEAPQPDDEDTIEIQVNFPAIREGDIPALVNATVAAMTLGNVSGEVVGIDEKAGNKKLGELLAIDGNEEINEEQYPEAEYDPNREAQKQAAADQAKQIAAAKPAPVVAPGQPGARPAVKEAFDRLAAAFEKLSESWK